LLHGHQDRAAPLAADRETLRDAEHDQDDRGPDPDGIEGGQEAYGGRRETHDGQRDDEVLLAPEPVAEVAEDYAAQGPGQEADRERGEGRERPMSGSTFGKYNWLKMRAVAAP
jgi:hypothetical protein